MSEQTVLYDVPGPRTLRRQRIGTVVALVLIAGLLAVAIQRLASRGQFDAELWEPWLNPAADDFASVWELVGRGLLATMIAASLAIVLSLVVGVGLGVARMMSGRYGRIPVVGFIELFRGLPVIITIVYVWRAS